MEHNVFDNDYLQQLTKDELIEIIIEMREEINKENISGKKKKFEEEVFPLWRPPWDK
nr:hypothetical protein [Paenibacillus bovis]